jgi:outer membrane receptor protein involved in Fe transport
MRWAKNIDNKVGIKLAWQLLKANDWMADDYRNVQRTSVLSKLVAGDRSTDPNYDGINVYGDETSANMLLVTQAIQENFRAGIASATGGLIPNIVNTLNAIIPANATQAQINAILAGTFTGPLAGLLPTVTQLFPFYWGLRQGWVPNQSVSRTGYNERDLVDYNTLNFKFTAGLHYKITPGIEASWNTYWGTGTTVYTGADRYSLRNFKMAQHKLEVRHKNWFVRGYTTQENAGEAYQATALGRLMQEAFSPSATSWYPTYIGNFIGFKQNTYNAGQVPNDPNAHAFARAAADLNRPLPGTAAFESLKKTLRSTPIGKGGSKFLDKSDLWAAEVQLNLSDALGFSETIEMITGVQWKQWVMNSQGTIFADSAGAIKISETGGYIQLKKRLLDDVLTLTGAVRYDKQTNFQGRFTPRFTAVIRAAKDNNIRLSYQTAYRFPTNQDQYIDLNTGSVQLIGALPEFLTYYGLNTSTGVGYTAESVTAARAASNTALLQTSPFSEVKPEDVSSYELGYKGLLNKKLLIDAYVYYSRYKDFFARIAVVQSATGTPAGVLNPLTSRNYSYIQNSADVVKALGWGIGVEYLLPRNFTISGNIFSDQLRDLQPGLISFFNAPKYRWNIGLRNDNVYKNIGFNVIVKWQDNNFYEGTFVTGTLPSFTWVDAQISYRMPKTKSLIRIGGTNIGNNYFRTGFGSPYVGGLYYVSYGYNIF